MTKANTKPSQLSNAKAADYLKRACNIMDEQETLKADFDELKEEAKDNGIDMKAFAVALKEIRKPLDSGMKKNANSYLAEYGQLSLFAE